MKERERMHSTPATKLTYADFLHFPDDGRRHEIIDGEHYVTPSPVARHQRILRRLANAMENWLNEHPIGEMFFAPFDVILSNFDVVEPDLLYVSHDRAEHVKSRGVFAPPDLVVEILSAGTRRTDELVKRKLYERTGVAGYWLIDPELDLVKVFRRDGDRFDRVAELTKESGDMLTTPLLPGLEIALTAILA